MSSTPCSPSNNRTFSDKISDYELSTLIGVGSFGRVYKAKYVDRGKCKSGSVGQVRECAVKCISKKSSPNLGKIYAEVSIHMRAKHENILQLYNVIEDEEHVYLILELCPGGSLMQFVKTQVSKGQTNGQHDDGKNDKSTLNSPILPYATIRKMMSQVCHGLDYLHRNGIIHRDLNLNNLLLLSTLDSPHDDFIIKIADFGLAIDINSPKQSANPSHKLHRDQQVMAMNMPVGTTICGTPGFISPEVWSQMQTVSPASDIFSLGSILFSLIAGYTPKGELDLTYYSPLAGDLISRLLAADPRQRPSISTTLTHPFMIGPFNTHRLAPISKTTRTINLSIDHEGVVKLIFFKNNSSIEISKSGDSISIVSNNGKVECFSLETLTPNHWKKYIYAWRFVELVKAKTPKVTVNCHQDSENQDILKACLMENGDFEVTMIDASNNSTHKILIDKRNENNLDRMDRQVKKRLFSLKEKCVAIEKQLSEASIDCFPATLGRKNKIISKDNNSIAEQGLTTTSSHIMRYAYVKGLGTASQLSNGMIQVAFSDGSSMSLASNSQIIFSHNGSQQMFHKHDSLPEFVKEKLALLPQVVEELRQKSPSMQCSK